MIIPNEAIKFILLQRTGYLIDSLFLKFLSKVENKNSFLLNLSNQFKKTFYADSIKNKFVDDIENEYKDMALFLPSKVDSVLDIGSGLGLMNLFLSNHYDGSVNIHLLDKSEIERNIYYGFNSKRTPFYNSLALAKNILIRNGVKEKNIHTHEVEEYDSCFEAKKYDLITSYISLGFHYPLKTYINEILSSLKDGGVLIIDIRKDTEQIEEIKRYFSIVEIISNRSKSLRISARV
jgi:SAM-dependent methyltransferase